MIGGWSEDSGADLLPAWETLEHDYIESGVPGLFVICPAPRVALFIDANGSRFGATFRLPDTGPAPPSPLDCITIAEVGIQGERHLELATAATDLYRNFYLLVADVVRGVVIDGIEVRAALAESLGRWQTLLRQTVLLSEERQAGLFGELWLLRRLKAVLGASAVDSWTGPDGQAHDFRLGAVEFEVKTTGAAGRVHVINGLGQLCPTVGAHLYLLSLRLAHGGSGGETLSEAVSSIRENLRGTPGALLRFNQQLENTGYHDQHAAHYSRRRRLADRAMLVPVRDGCPRLVPEALAALPLAFAPSRVRDVTYEIDLTGLGISDGEHAFLEILPDDPATPTGAMQ
jgi:hypothetical protein